jgi:tripartite-type tricarboxylate transporter receptor subunit TctC
MRFDPQKDLAPMALVAKSPFMLVVHPGVQAKSIPELVALAKAQPGKLNGASSGVGSTNHLTLEMFKALAKVDILVVPFKGGSPAIASVMGGQTNMIFNTPGTLLGHVAAGKLRGLGVTSRERVDFVELPAIAETVPGFEATVWYGVYGPKTLPARLVQRWNESINRYLKSPAAQTHLKRSHMIAAGGTPADLAAFHKSETERWGAVVKAAGIEPQ